MPQELNKVLNQPSIINIIKHMGCGSIISSFHTHSTTVNEAQNCKAVGQLKIRVTDVKLIENKYTGIGQNDNYLKLRISNQTFVTLLHHNFGNHQKIRPEHTTFNFAINSRNKAFGRMLSIECWSKEYLKHDKKIALGIVDLNPFLCESPSDENQCEKKVTCHINYDNSPAGKIALGIQFIPFYYQVLTFKIHTVALRDKVVRNRQVYVKLTIGEEIYETHPIVEDKKSIPEWTEAYHSFYVPDFISYGTIEVIEKIQATGSDLILGQMRIDMKFLRETELCQTYFESLMIDDEVVGAIMFQVIKGSRMDDFMELKSPRKLKIKKKSITKTILQDEFEEGSNKKILKFQEDSNSPLHQFKCEGDKSTQEPTTMKQIDLQSSYGNSTILQRRNGKQLSPLIQAKSPRTQKNIPSIPVLEKSNLLQVRPHTSKDLLELSGRGRVTEEIPENQEEEGQKLQNSLNSSQSLESSIKSQVKNIYSGRLDKGKFLIKHTESFDMKPKYVCSTKSVLKMEHSNCRKTGSKQYNKKNHGNQFYPQEGSWQLMNISGQMNKIKQDLGYSLTKSIKFVGTNEERCPEPLQSSVVRIDMEGLEDLEENAMTKGANQREQLQGKEQEFSERQTRRNQVTQKCGDSRKNFPDLDELLSKDHVEDNMIDFTARTQQRQRQDAAITIKQNTGRQSQYLLDSGILKANENHNSQIRISLGDLESVN